jgi:hypothetical protein
MRFFLRTACLILVIAGLSAEAARAQMPRERVDPGGPVEEVFWAPNVVLGSSVYMLPQGNMNVTIMHAFGIVTNGVQDLFGLDGAANIRFGVDYGLHDRLSLGVGRSRFDKLYDFRFKAKLLRQMRDNSFPIDVALKGDVGIMTVENGFDVADRLSYFASLLIARKVSERISLQVTPMVSHFNTVFIERRSVRILEEENDHIALGLAGRFVLSRRLALQVEYLPVLGARSDGTTDALSVGLDIETGGHVFQLFFTTSQWLTEQHVIARNTDAFFDGDIRFGFNVNRVFRLGSSE